MEKENKTILDEIEKQSDETTQTETTSESEELVEPTFDDGDEEEEFEQVEVNVTNKSKQELEEENGVKKEADGRKLTISEVSIKAPKIFKLEDGKKTRIEPRETKAGGGKFYSTKLKVRFVEDNLVEYYPSINIWVNDGKINTQNVQLDSSRYNENYLSGTKVAQIVRQAISEMYAEKNGEPIKLERKTINERSTIVVSDSDKDNYYKFSKSVSDQEILDWLVGKKVEIKTSKGVYDGTNWFRNDIKKFVK